MPMTASYIRTLPLLSPGAVFYTILEAFARNDDAPKVAMISAVLYNVMNVILDYLFILVFNWGMFGAAPLLSDILYGFVLITFNLILLNLKGNTGVAAFGIISSIAFVVLSLFIGLGQGIQPLASYYYGKKDRQSLGTLLKYAIITSIGVGLFVNVAIFLFADSITSVLNYSQDTVLAGLANEGVRIYFIAFLFVGITIVSVAFLGVTSMPKTAVVLSILRASRQYKKVF